MKKFFAFVLAMVMVACLFTACAKSTQYDPENDTTVYVYGTDLVVIPGYEYLSYSINTYTVYYEFSAVNGYSYMAPYIMNGHTCEYRGGEIVEVIPTVRIEGATN